MPRVISATQIWFCQNRIHYDKEKSCISQKNFCHAVEVELRLISASFSGNNFCKIDVISAKTQSNMTEKKYGFSHEYFCHTAFAKLYYDWGKVWVCHAIAAELRLSTYFSENNFSKVNTCKKLLVLTEIFF